MAEGRYERSLPRAWGCSLGNVLLGEPHPDLCQNKMRLEERLHLWIGFGGIWELTGASPRPTALCWMAREEGSPLGPAR